jgi:hypothetical protein
MRAGEFAVPATLGVGQAFPDPSDPEALCPVYLVFRPALEGPCRD